MKKLFIFLVIIAAMANHAIAQSLIQKFAVQDFVLSDSFKSPDGFYYGSIGYKLGKGTILMITGRGSSNEVRPMFIVRGPMVNGVEAKAIVNYFDTTYGAETNAVYTLPETGDYYMYFANGRLGQKGTIKTSMGVGSTDWLDDEKIFTPGNGEPFAMALSKLLRHALFNFNLIKGQPRTGYIGRIYNNTFDLPDANLSSPYTEIGDYLSGCTYLMDGTAYRTLPKKNEADDDVYDLRDSVIAIQKYEALKAKLAAAMPKTFTAGAEEKYTLTFEKKSEKNGRRILYTYTGSDALTDPADYLPELIASKKIMVELDLELESIIPQILLKVYSKR